VDESKETTMNIATGCSGIDAIAYAALLLGMEIKGQIEIDNFCNTILELRYPGIKRYKDIFNVRGDEFGAVDIFAAGIPCQPFSHAGKREGTEDDRYLWPEAIRIIRVMQPTWVIIENVDGIGSMEQSDSETVLETEAEICQDTELVLETIRKDLEEAGYNSVAIILPACSVEAPHQRYRYFIVGNSEGEQNNRKHSGRLLNEFARTSKTLGDSECSRCSGESRGRTEQEPEDRYSGIETMGDSECKRRARSHNVQESTLSPEPSESMADTTRELLDRGMHSRTGRHGLTDGNADVADTYSTGWEELDTTRESARQGHNTGSSNASGGSRPTKSGMGGNADGIPGRLHRPGGQEDSNGVLGAFEEIFTALIDKILWPAGYGSEQYDYEPPRVATGVKNRTNRLKVLGNAIVWQQIFPILLAIKLIEGGISDE
jgi:DNA (cytosine-5)-methyltransferase 1